MRMPSHPFTAPAVRYGRRFFFAFLTTLLLINCTPNAHNDDDPEPPEVPFKVYTAGYVDQAGVMKACYWENDSLILLSVGHEHTQSFAKGIVRSGSDIYISGNYRIPTGYLRPCYWKNGVFNTMENGSGVYNNYVEKITIYNNDVYVAGSVMPGSRQTACYWKNGQVNLLTNPAVAPDAVFSLVKDIVVSNGDVYATGGLMRVPGVYRACYWKNNQYIEMQEPIQQNSFHESMSFGIRVVNDKIYLGGYTISRGTAGGSSKAATWTDGILSYATVPTGNYAIYMTDIEVYNNEIYATGHYEESGKTVAGYWKGADFFRAPTVADIDNAKGTAIAVKDGKIYTGGYYVSTANTSSKPAVWINGIKTDLKIPVNASGAVNDIFVP